MSFCEFNTHAYEFFFNNLKNTGVDLFFLFFFGGFCFVYLYTCLMNHPQRHVKVVHKHLAFPFLFSDLFLSLSLSHLNFHDINPYRVFQIL